MLTCVTPDENILGNNFLKKNLAFSLRKKLNFNTGLKNVLTYKSNINNCKNPEIATP